MGDSDVYLGLEPPIFPPFKQIEMIEVFKFGIVLGLIPITLAGLFVTAYLQYRRGDQLDL
jgi:cytochrome b6-f complex subunit 5